MKSPGIRQIDYGTGSIVKAVLAGAGPMVFAQCLSLLYNIVDRMYIGRIPGQGAQALAGIGICFPILTLTAAFASLFGSGGAPLAAMESGKGNHREASLYLNASFSMLVLSGGLLMILCEFFAPQILTLFGARSDSLETGLIYLYPVLTGTVFSMIASGMNPYINAQGFPLMGMITVLIGTLLNIGLDPLFIFVFGWGIQGAALATVISQVISALAVIRFLTGARAVSKLSPSLWISSLQPARVKAITSLGLAGFIMQVTNSLVQAVANSTLSLHGGDLYISAMTIVSSVRQIVETPLSGLRDGASPVMSFNYGAGKTSRLRRTITLTTGISVLYAGVIWALILAFPSAFTSLFSRDETLAATAILCLHVYFFAFVFQALQFSGQTVFTALGRRNQAVFFSLFRKVILVVPLTLILPRHLGVMGVFAAEPVSNVIGGIACYATMYLTVWKKLTAATREQ